MYFGYDHINDEFVVKNDDDTWLRCGEGQFGLFGLRVAQQSHVADAVASHADATTFANVSTFLDALGAKINEVLVLVENVGINAKS